VGIFLENRNFGEKGDPPIISKELTGGSRLAGNGVKNH